MTLNEDENTFKARKKCTQKINQKNIEIPPTNSHLCIQGVQKEHGGKFSVPFLKLTMARP